MLTGNFISCVWFLILLQYPHGMRRLYRLGLLFYVCVSLVTGSITSTKFGSRYLADGLSEREEIRQMCRKGLDSMSHPWAPK